MFSGVLSEGSLPERFLFAADDVSLQFPTHNSTVLRLGTLSFRWILKCRRNICWVTTTEPLLLKYVSTAKARCSTDQRSMATEMLWVSLRGRSRTNSPRQRFHSQLCYQIVRYFCWALYLKTLTISQNIASSGGIIIEKWFGKVEIYVLWDVMSFQLVNICA